VPEPGESAPAAVRRAHADAFLSGWTAEGGPRSWHLPQDRDLATVGRAADADVHVVGDSQVSRLHARLERVAGQWSIVDDGLSRNGTLVNGRRVTQRVRLHDRDRITVGETLLVFCAPEPTGTDQTAVADAVPLPRNLTEAQLGVLRALCRPCLAGGPYTAPASNQDIARELSLSLDGVKTHLRTLFGKFGIGDLPQNQKRARLVELAIRWGVVSDGA
jgi:DNA-binding NarL/FixJ family response regulator